MTIAYLIYNNTNYGSGTISSIAGNNYTIAKSIAIPQIINTQNKSFYWNLTLNDATNVVTGSREQNVSNLTIGDCSTSSYVLYNFTLKDEEDKTTLAGATLNSLAKVNLQLYSFGSGSEVESYNVTYSATNPFAVCINTNLSNSNFYHDLQIQYGATGYATELYHIQNITLNSSSLYQNISLYDLNSTDSQAFKIIFRSSSSSR